LWDTGIGAWVDSRGQQRKPVSPPRQPAATATTPCQAGAQTPPPPSPCTSASDKKKPDTLPLVCHRSHPDSPITPSSPISKDRVSGGGSSPTIKDRVAGGGSSPASKDRVAGGGSSPASKDRVAGGGSSPASKDRLAGGGSSPASKDRVAGGGAQSECAGDKKKAQAGPALPPAALPADAPVYHKRGPGRAPKDANGADMLWDTGIGAWVDSRGQQRTPVSPPRQPAATATTLGKAGAGHQSDSKAM
jgi:hypothetical protein